MDSSPPANLSGDREKILQELIQGRESANKLLTIILGKPSGDDKSSSVSAADDLLRKIFASFAESISVLNRAPIEQAFDKIPVNTAGSLPIGLQSEDSEGSSKSTSVLKQRRGCYKRRNYYRCTHKFDQGCLATKQVQITEEDPPMHRTTYHGSHTCQNPLKPPQIILDSTIPGDNSNSVFLSFGSTNYPSTKLNHETYYPSNPTFPSVKQEYSPNQELKPSFDHNKSTSADLLLTFDSSGPMPTLSSGSNHGDMISSSGAYSCTASTHDDSHHSFDLDVFGGVGDFDVSEFGFC
ncbi:hypothetical protein C3L33_20569, partial [Rhododendron williamsianum]